MTFITTAFKKFDAKLLFVETGSLTYEIKTDGVYENFYEDKYLANFSNYPKDSKFYDPSSIIKISNIKDKSTRKTEDEFARLKSKMRSLTNADGKENKTGKGVNKHVVKSIRNKEFVDVLFNRRVMRHRMNKI